MTRKEAQTLKQGDKVFIVEGYGKNEKVITVTVVAVRSKYIYIARYLTKKVRDIIKKDRTIFYTDGWGGDDALDCVNFYEIEKTKFGVNKSIAQDEVEGAKFLVTSLKNDVVSFTRRLKSAEEDLAKAKKKLETKVGILEKTPLKAAAEGENK